MNSLNTNISNRLISKVALLVCVSSLLIVGCNNSPKNESPTNATSSSSSNIVGNVRILNTITVSADGKDKGKSAYELIQGAFGRGSIEAPDFYSNDHNETSHIIEDYDSVVGHHFVFLAHRDLDFDRGRQADRQRNEIKVFGRSDDELKAKKGETFQYKWKFKVSSDMSLTTRFSHFFQIKARNHTEGQKDNLNGNDNQPVITLSGAQVDELGKQLQIRHSRGFKADGSRTEDNHLASVNWSLITDTWVDVFVQITFAESHDGGKFNMLIKRLDNGSTIIDINEDNIDMWRGLIPKDFSRPKWGIYRSTAEFDSLRPDEEQVRFADFTVSKVRSIDY